MSETRSTKLKKAAMLRALEKSLCNVTTSAQAVKIARDTHYKWLKDDEVYAAKVAELDNVSLDFAEGKLKQAIAKNNIIATIFYLKTKGRCRGYIEKQDIGLEGKDGGPVEFTIVDATKKTG